MLKQSGWLVSLKAAGWMPVQKVIIEETVKVIPNDLGLAKAMPGIGQHPDGMLLAKISPDGCKT